MAEENTQGQGKERQRAPNMARRCESSDREASRSDREASRDLARMIVLHGHDPSVVEDDYFRSFVHRLNPEFEVPSRLAVEEMCDGISDEARKGLLSRLTSATPGSVSLAVGRAKTMEEQVLYVACHFIDDEWNLHKLILHAIVTGDHHREGDGPILGFEVSNFDIDYDFCGVMESHGLDDRVFVVAYETADKDIDPVLKNCFKPGDCTTYVDNVLHSIARCLLPDAEFTKDVVLDMEGLDLTRQERLQLLSELDLDYEWACEEQWCACYYSLKVLGKRGFSTKLIEDAEFFVKILCKVWEQVYRGIKRIFPASTCPTSNLCLAELLKLREILHSELARFSGDDAEFEDEYCYFPDDKEAVDVLREALDTVDNAIQDSYLVWSVPLALDPVQTQVH